MSWRSHSHRQRLRITELTMELCAAILVGIALTTLSAAFPMNMQYIAKERVFHQKLDHFDPYNEKNFTQRYFKADSFFRDGAPIFLEIGGEGPENGVVPGFVFEAAKQNDGMIFILEHRYYGKSLPEGYTFDQPTYLSAEQALEDIAYFIELQKERYPHSPWIVCGCSYAGNLATWMRLKYPHLVVGAIAGSAPVLAKADFYEYIEVVGEVIKDRAPLCHQKLVEANEEFKTLAKTNSGQRKLARMFRIPEYSSKRGEELHILLAGTLLNIYNSSVQYLPYYKEYSHAVCDLITTNNQRQSTLEILINKLMFSEAPDSLESIIRRHFNIGFRQLTHYEDIDSWKYQTCSQFAYFITLSSPDQPFGLVDDFKGFSNVCSKWGITLEMVKENVRKTNLRYGGQTPNVTNVVFMHGSHDPWHPLGVLSDLSSSARAFIFQGLSHCEFYHGRSYFVKYDERIPEWMKMFDEIDSIVRSWI